MNEARVKDTQTFVDLAEDFIRERQKATTDQELKKAGSLFQLIDLAASSGMLVTGEDTYCPAYRAYAVEDLLLDPLEKVPGWIEVKVNRRGEFSGFVIREPELCQRLQKKYFLHCSGGQFYDDCGQLEDEKIRSYILRSVSPFLNENISRRVVSILELLKIICLVQMDSPPENKIFLDDGKTLTVSKNGIEEKTERDAFTRNRLNVKYIPEAAPRRWYSFISELLYEEDVPALQEFMGYCLIPTTKAQAGLFLIGNGGEGKSRIMAVMADMFGRSCYSGSLHKMEENRFETANLEGRLLMLDDDLRNSAFEDTANFKRIITADTPLSIERKGKDAREIISYARVFGCGNEFPSALYDRSDGFYRRQLLIKCKPKPENRKDDKDLTAVLLVEKSGILNWMLEGLLRLMRNDFEFTRSARMIDLVRENQLAGDPVAQFMADSTWVVYEPDGAPVMTKVLAQAFKGWCEINAVSPPKESMISRNISRIADRRGCVRTPNARNGLERGRGYSGIKLTDYAKQNKKVPI